MSIIIIVYSIISCCPDNPLSSINIRLQEMSQIFLHSLNAVSHC